MGRPSPLLFQWSCLSETSLTSTPCSDNRWPPQRKVAHAAHCARPSSCISSPTRLQHWFCTEHLVWWPHLRPSCSGWSRRWLCRRCTAVSPMLAGWPSWRWSQRGYSWARWVGPRTWPRWDGPRTVRSPARSLPRTGRWRRPRGWSGWSPVCCKAEKQTGHGLWEKPRSCWESHCCEIPVVHLDPPVEVDLLTVLQPADTRRRKPLGLAHEAGCACSRTGLALRSLHNRRWHYRKKIFENLDKLADILCSGQKEGTMKLISNKDIIKKIKSILFCKQCCLTARRLQVRLRRLSLRDSKLWWPAKTKHNTST